MKDGFVITDTSWAPYTEARGTVEGETYVESLPQWLIDNVQKIETDRESRIILSSKLTHASQVIQPLQDDFDIEEITDEDLITLKAWKKYRSVLAKTPERAEWPELPDWPTPPDR